MQDNEKKPKIEGEIILNSEPQNTHHTHNQLRSTHPQTLTHQPQNNSEHSHKHSIAHPLSAFCLYPSNINFADQDVDEELVLLIRRDIITNAPWVFFTILAIFSPPVIIPQIIGFLTFVNLSFVTQVFLLLSYYLYIIGYVLVNFSIWYFHVSLITNKRIIDMDLASILTKHVSETRLDLIQDVSYAQTGAIRSIFNYGDVFVQTAGQNPNVEFDKAPDPSQIATIIGNLIQEFKK